MGNLRYKTVVFIGRGSELNASNLTTSKFKFCAISTKTEAYANIFNKSYQQFSFPLSLSLNPDFSDANDIRTTVNTNFGRHSSDFPTANLNFPTYKDDFLTYSGYFPTDNGYFRADNAYFLKKDTQ